MPIWGYGPKEMEFEGGIDQLVQLNVPHRGELTSITLEQVGGADDGVFEIFDSEVAAKAFVFEGTFVGSNSLSSSSTSSSGVATGDPAVHSVTQGKLVITSGHHRSNDIKRPYRNRDGTYTLPVRRLWMVINVQGAGIKRFALAMMIIPAVLDD